MINAQNTGFLVLQRLQESEVGGMRHRTFVLNSNLVKYFWLVLV